MKQTNNYKLNQWEKTDRIMREDFNGDNLKVEEAMTGLAAEVAKKADAATTKAENLWVKLGEQTLGGAGSELAVSIPNAEQYRSFQLYFSGSGPLDIDLAVNGNRQNLTKASDGSSTKTAQFLVGKVQVIRGGTKGFLAEGDAKLYDGDITWGRGSDWTDRTTVLSRTVTVKLIGVNKDFGTGSHLVAYGLKV